MVESIQGGFSNKALLSDMPVTRPYKYGTPRFETVWVTLAPSEGF